MVYWVYPSQGIPLDPYYQLMSSSGPAYLYSSSVVQQSAIADKYYLQLADHSFMDLLREAVKSILIFNLPLEELPILHLQKEIYLIYDNRVVKEGDVLEAIKQEIREAAKLQKKFLDLSFTHLEKEKASLSDMRDHEEDPWSISWNRHRAKDTDDSLKKSYNVVASLFCNNYMAFVQSIREIARLLDHLHQEGLIPPISGEELEESLLEIVTHQFFLQYNCLDLHKVLPIMSQQQKERFIFCSEHGVDLRKKITKYASEPSLYDIFMPNRRPNHELPLCQHDNKNQIKRLMKEMFLKEFKNNDILSPLIFDESGKLKLLDQYRHEDEAQEYYQEYDEEAEEDIIARFAARRGVTCDPQNKEIKPQSEAKKEVKPEMKQEVSAASAAKKDPKVEQVKKEVKSETKKDAKAEEQKKQPKPSQIKKEVKPQLVKPEQKIIDAKDKKINGSPIKSQANISSQTLAKEKQSFEIPLIKSQSKKDEPAKAKADLPLKPQPAKDIKNEAKQKPKPSSQSAPIKEQKPKVPVETKQPIKQPIKDQKVKKKDNDPPELIKQGSKAKQSPVEGLQISTTKIVLSSGTTLEARVTSLTISAEDPDKFNKSISLFKGYQSMRMTNSEALQQIAKGYGHSEINIQGFQDKSKVEETEKEKGENEPEESAKKKKKKNKKKKNKKNDEPKEQMARAKSDSLAEQQKIELAKTSSHKVETVADSLTEEEKAIFNSIDNLEIDDKARVECKIEEDVLNSWRKQSIALKKTFPK